MKFLLVVAFLIVGATAHDFGSLKPSDHRGQRGPGGPHGGGRPHGGGEPFQPPHGPRGDCVQRGILLNPNITSSLSFIAVYRADNVTLQNANVTLPIKEGESTFLLPCPLGPPPKHGRNPPPPYMSYVTILYNSNSTTPLSFEFGVTPRAQAASMIGSESDEDGL